MHSKHGNWIRARRAWKAIGVNLSTEYLAQSWEKIQQWENTIVKKVEPGGGNNPAQEGKEVARDSTLSISTTTHTDPQTKPTQDPQRRGAHVANIHDMFPSPFFKAQDLKGKAVTFTIEEVSQERIGTDKKERPVLSSKKQKKRFVANKTNALLIEEALGTAETEEWVDKKITLYPCKVDFQGKRVWAIRVRVLETDSESSDDGSEDD